MSAKPICIPSGLHFGINEPPLILPGYTIEERRDYFTLAVKDGKKFYVVSNKDGSTTLWPQVWSEWQGKFCCDTHDKDIHIPKAK